MTERKYALSKVAPGDYLLPSNEGQTIWRVARYTDGPSKGLDDWPRDREVWGIWRWPEPVREGGSIDLDWSRWEMCEGMLPSRAEAIRSALS